MGLVADVGGLRGDYNDDGAVDSADYVVWREGLGCMYTPGDYPVWRAHFGQTAASFVMNATVPEPESLVMIWAGILAILFVDACVINSRIRETC
jgi:hypothetical protein